jgi:hypothetical protein
MCQYRYWTPIPKINPGISVALRKAHLQSIVCCHNHCHHQGSSNSAFMAMLSCSKTSFARFAAHGLSASGAPVDAGAVAIMTATAGAPPPARGEKWCCCFQFSCLCCIFFRNGNLHWSLIYRLPSPIMEVIIHQLPINGTLVICVTISWILKLAFCARSLTSTSTTTSASAPTLVFLLRVEELLSIRFDSRVIFWSGADVNLTSRLVTSVTLLEFFI